MNIQGVAPRLVAGLGVLSLAAQAASAASLTVDIGGNNQAVADITSFTAADPTVGGTPAAVTDTLDVDAPPNGPNFDPFPANVPVDSGDGITGVFNTSGNGITFTSALFGGFNGEPLLTDYSFVGNGNTMTNTLSDITGLSDGDPVRLIVYSVGDAADQDGAVTVTYNGISLGTKTTEADGSGSPFVVFNFSYVAAADSIAIDVTNANGAGFSAINGFSISNVPIPEPAGLAMLALGCCGAVASRRK